MAGAANIPQGAQFTRFMDTMNDIRSDIRENANTLTERIRVFREDMIHRFESLQSDVASLDQRLDDVDRSLASLDERSDTAGDRLNTIIGRLSTANGAPINLEQRLNTIDTYCTGAGTQLGVLNQILTPNGVPTALRTNLTTITDRLASNGRQLTSIINSLINANGAISGESIIGRIHNIIDRSLSLNGNPINLDQHLTTMNGRLNTINASSNNTSIMLDNIRQDITTSSGLIRRLDGQINTIVGSTNGTSALLRTVSRSLIPLNGEPINMADRLNVLDMSLDNIDGNVTRQLNIVSRSLLNDNNQPYILHANMTELRMEMRAGHFNSAARTVNSTASCCNNSISSFHGIDNETIPHFPITHAHFKHLSATDLDRILGRLGVNPGDTLARKRKRLKNYLGLQITL